MAKAKEAKTKKANEAEQSTQLPLDDMRRWRPVAEITRQLLPHVDDNDLIAYELTEAVASEKIRCIRRRTNEHALNLDRLTDPELAIASREEIDNQPVGHRELLTPTFWAEHFFACSLNGEIRVARRLPPNADGSSEPSFTFTANRVFYLWEPDCVKAWPALAPHVCEVDASEPSPSGRRPDLTADQVTDGVEIILIELRRRRLAGESRLSNSKALSLLRERLSVTLDQATDRRLLDACIRPARRQHREEISRNSRS
jgi:hypothetical protein